MAGIDEGFLGQLLHQAAEAGNQLRLVAVEQIRPPIATVEEGVSRIGTFGQYCLPLCVL